MSPLDKMRAEMTKLDAAVEAMPSAERRQGADALRNELLRLGMGPTEQDERTLEAFVQGWIDLPELCEQLYGRL